MYVYVCMCMYVCMGVWINVWVGWMDGFVVYGADGCVWVVWMMVNGYMMYVCMYVCMYGRYVCM